MFPPSRIVCLTEETVETLYLLGEQDRIVGISGYVVRPPQACREKPRVSAFTSANIDKILALQPDLVLTFSDLQADIAADPGEGSAWIIVYALESQGAGEREKRRVITAYALDQLRLGQRALRGCQRHPARIDRDEKNIDVLVGIGGTIEPSRIDRQRPDWTLEANDATGHTPFDAPRRHLEADAVAAWTEFV